MRITIDGRLWGLENAGLGRYIMNLCEGMKDDRKNEYSILLRKKYFNSLKFPGNWTPVLAEFHHYGLAEQLKLPAIISGTRPDIVHFPHFNVPLMYRGKFVVTIHDILMHKQKGFEATTLSAPVYLLKRLGYRTIFDYAVYKSSKIIVPSDAVRDEILDEYKVEKNKISVIAEGVSDTIGFKKGIEVRGKYFIYTGNAYPHKNLKRLIEAILELNKKTTQEVKIAIVSSRNVFIERLNLLIKQMNAEKYVILLGFVPDENLGHLYRNSLGFVFPSISEGFGLPGLEAMKAGTLVMASDIPAFREVYSSHAVFFDPEKPEEIAALMKKTMEMPESVRSKKIKEVQKYVSKFTWEKAASETLKIFES
jgi:glycosyltransferase involved in cell wall biosynthesis